MPKRLLILVLGLSLVVPAATSAETLLLGPKTFTAGPGKPQTFSEAFAVDIDDDCDGKAVFVLTVRSGDAGGSNGLSSATVTLNDVLLLRENDFNQTVGLLERDVTLLAANMLKVDIKSHGSVSISVRKEIEVSVSEERTLTLSSKKQTFTETVNIADPAGEFTLTLRNGDAAGQHRVVGGSVSVNGVVVISDQELSASFGNLRKRVALQGQNSIVAELKGDSGDVVRIAMKRIADESICNPAPIVFIDSPAEGATVSNTHVMVTGRAIGRKDSGVSVNGVPAEMDLGHSGSEADPLPWFADVPLDNGPMTLTVIGSASEGAIKTVTREINVVPDPASLHVDTWPRSGAVPLKTTFELLPATTEEIRQCEVDFNGDGAWDSTLTSAPYVATYTYLNSGLHHAAARCTRRDGAILSMTTWTMVQSFTDIDGLLRDLWNRFTTALARGDVEGALLVMGPNEKERYRTPLMGIRTLLPQYIESVQSIESVWIEGPLAHYLLQRDQDGQIYGYHIYFSRDVNGVWRLLQF